LCMSPYAGPLNELLLTVVVGNAGQPLEHRSLLPLQGGFSLGQLSCRMVVLLCLSVSLVLLAVICRCQHYRTLEARCVQKKYGFLAAIGNLHAYPTFCAYSSKDGLHLRSGMLPAVQFPSKSSLCWWVATCHLLKAPYKQYIDAKVQAS